MSLHKAIAVSLLLHAAFFAAAMIRIVYFPVIQAARGFAVEFMNSGAQGQMNPADSRVLGHIRLPGAGSNEAQTRELFQIYSIASPIHR